MENDKQNLLMAIEIIDVDIDKWQFYAKCNPFLSDLAFKIVCVLVEEKKKIVEKLKKLDI